MKPDEAVALSNCDREPVHIPGRIQSIGALIAIELETLEIKFFSDNLILMFPNIKPVKLNDDFGSFFQSNEVRHAIRGALGLPTIRTQRERVGVFGIGGIHTDIAVFATDLHAVIELEPASSESGRPQSAVSQVRSILSSLELGNGVDRLLDSAVLALRRLTGFDRVMAYRFLENGDGEVVAEAKGNGIEAFLGLRYPASDIPQQVRRIALQSPLRMINSVQDTHANILASDDIAALDMTLGHLRGVSPIHVEYLKNMGVSATMNTSVVLRGELWGLFAFHHYRKRHLSPDRRSICELLSQMVAMQIQIEEERELMANRGRAQAAVMVLEDCDWNLQQAFQHIANDLLAVILADGVALVEHDQIACTGTVPQEPMIREICGLTNDEVFSLDCLRSTSIQKEASASGIAGALVVRLRSDICLAFFRNELIQEVRWAGGKEKTITHGPNGPRLTPRASFEEYKESVKGRCKPWSASDVSAATETRRAMVKLIHTNSNELSRILDKQKKQQDLLIAELHHRVRNTLALVQSIARQTKSSTVSLDHYVESLEQRIAALSSAHNMVGDSGMQWAKIDELVNVELKPYRNSQADVLSSGPDIAIRGDIAPLVSLLFHEMMSNAVKHGALSDDGKSLDITWRHKDGGVEISWLETSHVDVVAPTRQGFGLALIQRAVPFQCGGKSELVFQGNQLAIDFWLPPDALVAAADPIQPKKTPVIAKKIRPPVSGSNPSGNCSAFVLEDNMVLAMEMEKMLGDLGYTEIETASSIQSAEGKVGSSHYDIAILDINLGQETSFIIARKLQQLRVPIIFVSGYDSKHVVPEDLVGIPRLVKPINREHLSLSIGKTQSQLP